MIFWYYGDLLVGVNVSRDVSEGEEKKGEDDEAEVPNNQGDYHLPVDWLQLKIASQQHEQTHHVS